MSREEDRLFTKIMV